jgi:MOSC domain-containing protein YiiM
VRESTCPGSRIAYGVRVDRADGTVVSVNIAARAIPRPQGPDHLTGIDKRPVAGPVAVGPLGPAGDKVMDTRRHGGPDKALYAYATEDYAEWERRLGRSLRPGRFGENLTLSGVDVSGALIGERWRIGDVVVEVRQPRTPCGTFKAWMSESKWGWRFIMAHMPGAYLSVVEPGRLRAGDPVRVLSRPADGFAIRDCGMDAEPEVMKRLLDSGLELADSVRFVAETVVRRGTRLTPSAVYRKRHDPR